MKHTDRAALRRWRLLGFVAVFALVWGSLSAVAYQAMPVALASMTRETYRAQLAAHYPFSQAPEMAEGGDTVVAAQALDITRTNPAVASDTPTQNVLGLVFLGLWGISPIDGQPVPSGLADRWVLSPDGMTYTFFLNREARWHDGIDITADDVIMSLDAQASDETGSSFTGAFRGSIASYRAVDADTVELVAHDVLADLLLTLTLPILPKHIWEGVPFSAWATDPGSTGQDPARVVGSGPFRFEEWIEGDHVTLVRNNEHFDVVPTIERYVVQIMPDATALANALVTGAVDIAPLQLSDVSALQTTDGIEVAMFPTLHVNLYLTNLDPAKTTLFIDPRVRQALFYALDREAIVRTIEGGLADVAHGTQPTLSIAYAPERMTTRYTFDIEKARSLLAEAGWVDTNDDGVVEKDGQELRFELIHETGQATVTQIVTYVQDAWRAIGVEMTPVPLSFGALVERLTTFDYAVGMIGFDWDASGNQYTMFNCDQYGVGFNLVKYCNPAVDVLNNAARRELDRAKRVELLIQAQILVNDDLPVATFETVKSAIGYSDSLHNYFPGGYGDPGPAYLWLGD